MRIRGNALYYRGASQLLFSFEPEEPIEREEEEQLEKVNRLSASEGSFMNIEKY